MRDAVELARRGAEPFVFRETLSLADVVPYGQWAMLEAGSSRLVDRLSPVFAAHAKRVEGARAR